MSNIDLRPVYPEPGGHGDSSTAGIADQGPAQLTPAAAGPPRALAGCSALIVPLVILAGLADWLFHLDSVIRAALLAALARRGALAGVSSAIVRPLVVRFADLDIALRIEERWPGLNDRLASTIQFLRWTPATIAIGSPALAGGDRPPGRRGSERDRLPRGDRAQAGAPGAAGCVVGASGRRRS